MSSQMTLLAVIDGEIHSPLPKLPCPTGNALQEVECRKGHGDVQARAVDRICHEGQVSVGWR